MTRLPSPSAFRVNLLVKLGELTGQTYVLPMLLFAPTARCNSRCLSCDWWRADGKGDLTLDEIRALAAELPGLGTRTVVLTGGEPLVRADIIEVADVFRAQGLTLQLLTSGLALEKYAAAIAARFAAVTISLDGHTPELYRRIRGVDGLGAVSAGVRKLRELGPHIPIRARSTLHRLNFRHAVDLVDKALELGLQQISFLAADLTSDAFNHAPSASRSPALPLAEEAGERLWLDLDEAAEFEAVIEAVVRRYPRELEEARISPGPIGLRRLPQYYRAQRGQGAFPPVDCNAPWMSVFVEADGAVRPCFFHPRVGNLRERPLGSIMREHMPTFRRSLRVEDNPTCQRCVCTLKTGLRSRLA